MELSLTGGVLFTLLCTIKKDKLPARETRKGNTDPTSELEMMLSLWELAAGHRFTMNKDSLRSKLTNYKNCGCNGNALIPFEAVFNDEDEAEIVSNYMFDIEATKKRIKVFTNTFIDNENKVAIDNFVKTVNEIVEFDRNFYKHNTNNEVVSQIIRKEEVTLSFDDYFFSIFYFVISSHADNYEGKETLEYIKAKSFCPKPTSMKVVIIPTSSELIEQYISNLEEPVNAREGWDEYIKTLKNDFSKVRIYYDPDREYSFKEIYIPSSVSTIDPYGIRTAYEKEYKFDFPTVKRMSQYSRNLLISGAGGLGKTMLLRHLLLDAIENDAEHVPIFISVRNFTDEQDSFFDFIYEQSKLYYFQLEKEKLLKTFSSEQCILFLDGFDEIPFEHLKSFIRQYNKFIRVDFGNIIIMSSRPVSGAMPNHFAKLYLLPFDSTQACQLVDKLTAIQHNYVLCEKFKAELKTNLLDTHSDYTENPLLLTLMLRIYEQNGNVPKEKFDFYYNAYEVLSHKHDALKEDGGFSRPYRTGLTPTDFAYFFQRFCAYSLLLDGQVAFTESEMLKYFERIIENSENRWNFELKDFIYDATSSTGLMYLQGNKYIFIHRSMQEFFCAWFLSKQEDSILYDIVMELQKHGRGLVWETLELLDERIHYKMEKYVYLPYFNSIFLNKKDDEAYLDFLFRFFNIIRYKFSSLSFDLGTEILPAETLYCYCMNGRRRCIFDTELCLPSYEEFKDEGLYLYYDGDGERKIGVEAEVPRDYDFSKYGIPELVGNYYKIELSKEFTNSHIDIYLEHTVFDDSFPLRLEFKDAKEYWIELKEKYQDKANTYDLISLLH